MKVLNLVTISKRRILKKISRENPRTLYSDMMKTLHEEVFYEVVYQLEEVEHVIKKIKEVVTKLEEEIKK
ncbi:MAG: hypothetical protein LM583_07630 [Desulfurococcaceae archaeon]|nr:hypothetical protein [Desulfurococcaceae archaeon]